MKKQKRADPIRNGKLEVSLYRFLKCWPIEQDVQAYCSNHLVVLVLREQVLSDKIW